MVECPKCKATIMNSPNQCPLCGEKNLIHLKYQDDTSPPYPIIPLRFTRKKVYWILTLSSILIGILFLFIEALWLAERQGLQLSVFGVVSLWSVVSIIIRKRRNIAKGVTYLYVLFSFFTLYLDYATGWGAWSTSYAIPIISIFSIMAMYLSVRIVRLAFEDYLMYLVIAIIVGMFPALFLFFDWLTTPIPTLFSILFCVITFAGILVRHGKNIWKETRKRMDV